MKEDGDIVVLVALTQPTPEPTPSDDDVVDEDTDLVDETLWKTVNSWVYRRHQRHDLLVAKALREWAVSKGLTEE